MKKFGFLFSLLIGCCCKEAQSQVVTIYHNPSQGVQTESHVFSYLQSRLAGFVIDNREASIDRALKNIANGEVACVRNLIKNKERSKTLLFSDPVTYFLGLQVFVGPMVEVNGTKNSSSLEDLLAANPNWLLGIEKERSYGDKADAIIANTAAEQLYIKEGSENEAQMYSMLMSGRFEVLLEYPSVVAFYGKNGKVKPRIVELNTFSPLITGHIACSDTPATQALLAALNVELELLRNDSRFIQWHLDYIDKSLHDSFSAEYRKAHQD